MRREPCLIGVPPFLEGEAAHLSLLIVNLKVKAYFNIFYYK